MSTSFSRTFRALGADRGRLSLAGGGLAAALLCAWAAWFTLARVTLYEVTERARLEVAAAAYPIQSVVGGRVLQSRLAIGKAVEAGEILVELDAESYRLQIREASAQLAGLAAEAAALSEQATAEERARAEQQRSARVAVEQAQAREREARAPAEYSSEELDRLRALRARGLIAERDYARGVAEAQKHGAAADSARVEILRIEQEQQTLDRERDTQLQRLRAEIVRIEGQSRTLEAAIARLQHEVERRLVRAPASGRLGEARTLSAGAVVSEGEQLAAIVPDGRLRAVAQFPPPAAIGRLRPGQPARLRLHGFPWTQHGTIEATVTRVADEIRDGSVRVELDVRSNGLRTPLQHGMPGSLEVQVEQISPAALVLRLAGESLMQPRARHFPLNGQPDHTVSAR